MAASILSDLARILVQQLTLRAISGAGGLMGFASGGSFTVGGSGGTDSSLVAFRATPGEHVTVSPPGAANGGGRAASLNLSVNVYNEVATAQVTTKTVEGPSGPQLHVLVSEIVRGDLRSGGRISQELDKRGLPRKGRRQ
jgi:hypothetical protein